MSKQTQDMQWQVVINEKYCKGCEICIEFCPTKVFGTSQKLNNKGYYLPVILDEEKCTGCRLCELLCPELAIVLTGK
jgi:2-oxoglutarate ferredoxin oxidoreductase subunit delta